MTVLALVDDVGTGPELDAFHGHHLAEAWPRGRRWSAAASLGGARLPDVAAGGTPAAAERKTPARKRALNLPAYWPTILNAPNPRASRSACQTCQKGAHVRCRPQSARLLGHCRCARRRRWHSVGRGRAREEEPEARQASGRPARGEAARAHSRSGEGRRARLLR